MNVSEIPLKAAAQRLSITLGDREYRLTVKWNTFSACWVADIADSTGAALASGIPFVTGADLLGQLGYLEVAGGLFVVSDDDADAVPTFENLGLQGHVYFAGAA